MSYRHVQVACLLAVAVHLLPLLLADYFYMDDSWRAQLAGNAWAGEGRVLNDWFYAALGFSASAPNLFPLPLLLAAIASALALARLARHYFAVPSVGALLVVLPLWFNPYFLQNLSYQYDGPTMALALAACVLAITLEPRHARALAGGALLVAVAMAFYQVSLNVFAGLCCVEVLRQVLAGNGFRQVGWQALGRLGQLLGGCLLYFLSAYQLMTPLRQGLLPFDAHWPATVGQRLGLIAERVGLLLTPATGTLAAVLLALALAALALAAWRVARGPASLPARLGLLLALWLPLPLVVLLVPGLTLLFSDFNDGARTLMGLGVLLLLLALLAHDLLRRLRLGWLLVVPLLCMLSFAYAYGRVLVVQKELHQAVTFTLAHDIAADPRLAAARRYYVLDIGSSGQWLPAAQGSYTAMPALRYVLNINYLLLPEMMPRVGLSNFGSHPPLDRQQVLARSPQPLARGKFYAIHLVDDVAYVLMRTPQDPEGFSW
ncbi:glucosyltransferase domain-containing protein [Pseudomonas entomophila]|uniref:glucosyltransferase domain-containing protein n=1 Tax=Pseudomonas entomophila TaxID=312306 RepID=UPI0023D7EE29|nr:glucosyltransferase domain-containing protein [Pseudomonas entomophila]MDF0732839.1 glucosyltransferase domain-containing protein [Pseudomonas entomophila]